MDDLIRALCAEFVSRGNDTPTMTKLLTQLVYETQPADFRYKVKFSKKERDDNARALAEEHEVEAPRLAALTPPTMGEAVVEAAAAPAFTLTEED